MSIVGSEQWMYSSGAEFYDFPIEQSLRFNDDDNAYLSWTPASAGNLKTWTWSGWVKRGNLGGFQNFFIAGTSGSSYTTLFFDSSNKLSFQQLDSSTQTTRGTSLAVFRDVSAWYNIIFAYDSTQATNSNGLKLYVNGVQQTLSFDAYQQNSNAYINSTSSHGLGGLPSITANDFDGYFADVNFIDGQQLDATSFGEFKSGIWIPKDTADLTFGSNGFRLQFGDTTEANGFNTVTYTGNQTDSHAISGVGFSSAPDFVWIKERSSTSSHLLVDSVRGATKGLASNATTADENLTAGEFVSFDSDGFTVDNNNRSNQSGQTYVAWCWDAGSGSAASNTDGSITSTVKANTDYGFSIVSYVGNGTAGATVGHSLGVEPDVIITKGRSATSNWFVYHSANTANPETEYLTLETTNATTDNSTTWNDTAPTSSVFSIGQSGWNNTSGGDYIAYCFAEKAGYSSIGSYSGNGSTSGPTITTGFLPAFVMIKRTDVADNWHIADNTRSTDGTFNDVLRANLSNAESANNTSFNITYNDTGFTLANTNSELNASGGTYIYMAFADTRNAAFWKDTSGEGNDWQHNNLVFSDVVPDSTTNNFCTYNPNSRFDGNGTFSEGNLRFSGNSSGDMSTRTSTVIPAGMKFYFEAIYNEEGGSGGQARLGIDQTGSTADREKSGTGLFSFDFRGSAGTPQADDEGTLTTYGSQPAEGDVVGIAVDLENGKLYAHKANSYYNSGDPAAGTGAVITGIPDLQSVVFMSLDGGVNYNSWHINFGQDSTFAGRKAAGGNADENGYGDFAHPVPSGFLSLCSLNLPNGAIDTLADETPEDYFNTVLYTGDGNTGRTVTGVGFQPDFAWIKERSSTSSHILSNAIAGSTKLLSSNTTDAEATDSNKITSFDSDGYTLGSSGAVNQSSQTYVAWNWKANGSGVLNEQGSIASTVSVGATSQQNWFSVVSYVGNKTAGATVGHGLGVVPDMIIVKNRDDTDGWRVYHSGVASDPETDYLELNSTAAAADSTNMWNDTAPTSSVFSLGTASSTNQTGEDLIAYCFANAENLCRVGSYVGNGSSDGTFVYTGFRPAWVMVKNASLAATSWLIWDEERSTYNIANDILKAQSSNAEVVDNNSFGIDILSNGFKVRSSYGDVNQSGNTIIFLAIASQPFKYSNAR